MTWLTAIISLLEIISQTLSIVTLSVKSKPSTKGAETTAHAAKWVRSSPCVSKLPTSSISGYAHVPYIFFCEGMNNAIKDTSEYTKNHLRVNINNCANNNQHNVPGRDSAGDTLEYCMVDCRFRVHDPQLGPISPDLWKKTVMGNIQNAKSNDKIELNIYMCPTNTHKSI